MSKKWGLDMSEITVNPHASQPAKNGKSVAFLMVAFLTATFAFQLNASMLSPALVTMQNEEEIARTMPTK